MREARAADVGPYCELITQLQAALQLRSEQLLHWRRVPQGHMADIHGGKLLLAIFPEYASLTMIYESRVDIGEEVRAIERGRRLLKFGKPDKLQRLALELATRGVPGGPTFTGEGWTWDRVAEDGSRRMSVPQGELRISRADAGTATLTHDDDSGVELLAIEGEAILERQALTWWQHRTERPLRVVVNGQIANLRSLEVAGLIGYHPVTDNSFVALARAGEEFALLFVEGCYARLAARITWDEAIAGKPFNVDELLLMMERSAANHGPAANMGAEAPPAAGPVLARATPEPQASPAVGVPGMRASCPPGCTPMAEPHRELCERYFKRLCGQLRGRGARKAREIVRHILAMLEGCRGDITGTRQEVHRELERVLRRAFAGGDRNIRDALDLLVKHALFVKREEGTRCTVLFSQLHDPGSEVMLRIGAEMAAVPPRPTAVVSEERIAETGEGECGPTPEAGQGDEEEQRTHAPAAAEEVSAVIYARASTVAATLVDTPVTGVVAESAAIDETSSVVDPLAEAAPEVSTAPAHLTDITGVVITAQVCDAGQPGAPGSIHVFQALVRQVAEPPPQEPARESRVDEPRESRDVPIITTGENPRIRETSMRGFTRHPSDLRAPRDPEPDRQGRMVWETNAKAKSRPGSGDHGSS